MPRGPRLDFPGALHHVMARGIERREIFCCDDERAKFTERLGSVLHKTGTELFAWALMPNHIHLLMRTGEVRLGDVMRRLLGGYATAFNRRQRRCGHLFQNRFKSILVEEEAYLLELVRYIHLNPLRAGIVPTPEDLDQYPWTGHRCILGHHQHPWQDTERVLALFGQVRGPARVAYREFVKAGIVLGRRPELTTGQVIRRFGKRVLNVLRRGRESWAADERVLGSEEFVLRALRNVRQHDRPRPQDEDLDRLIRDVAATHTLTMAEVTGNGIRRDVVQARAIVCFVAVRHYGFSLAQVARVLNISGQSVRRGIENAPTIFARQNWSPESFAA